ncbi:hypothetical protein B4Q04_09360 [Zobellia sp. OII3]|nr:hypothetical protein B4Q04_09360 [Zobellia sp. OII3]
MNNGPGSSPYRRSLWVISKNHLKQDIMAKTEFHKMDYSGDYLEVGATHNWWLTHSDYTRVNLTSVQVNVTAHPWVFLPHYYSLIPSELSVENVRSRVTENGLVMYFRVKNTGPNPVAYYGVGISFIDE